MRTEYTYYRAMGISEFAELEANLEQYATNLNQTTYWTNSFSAASLYAGEGRIIVEIVIDRDIPKAYHGIAEGCDDLGNINNHHEVKMSRRMMNDVLINITEMHCHEHVA